MTLSDGFIAASNGIKQFGLLGGGIGLLAQTDGLLAVFVLGVAHGLLHVGEAVLLGFLQALVGGYLALGLGDAVFMEAAHLVEVALLLLHTGYDGVGHVALTAGGCYAVLGQLQCLAASVAGVDYLALLAAAHLGDVGQALVQEVVLLCQLAVLGGALLLGLHQVAQCVAGALHRLLADDAAVADGLHDGGVVRLEHVHHAVGFVDDGLVGIVHLLLVAAQLGAQVLHALAQSVLPRLDGLDAQALDVLRLCCLPQLVGCLHALHQVALRGGHILQVAVQLAQLLLIGDKVLVVGSHVAQILDILVGDGDALVQFLRLHLQGVHGGGHLAVVNLELHSGNLLYDSAHSGMLLFLCCRVYPLSVLP